MSTTDYDECEKVFCGSWTVSKDENVEKFLAASGELDFNKILSYCNFNLWSAKPAGSLSAVYDSEICKHDSF